MSEPRRVLIEFRSKIDKIDKEIVQLLSQRFKLASKISEAKLKLGMSIIDVERETYVLNSVEKIAEDEFLNKNYAREIFQTIIDCTLRFEEDLRRSNR